MKVLKFNPEDPDVVFGAMDRRAAPSVAVRDTVADVLANVRKRGDVALLEYNERFDGAHLPVAGLRVSEAEMAAARASVAPAVVAALEASRANVAAFALRGLRENWTATNGQGAEVGERFQPFERVGIYVPGGSAPLVSTALMTVTLAAVAQCPEIVVCTPPNADGEIQPALLRALDLAGATEIYKIGGAQALAAMGYGTETIVPVVKVFGPGNQYVVEAKRQLFGQVAVDLLPGPSEVLVLADEGARPEFVAADMLAQAEHGADSLVALVTTSPELLRGVEKQLNAQAKKLGRQAPLKAVLKEGCQLVLVPDLATGVRLANAWAPEHLSLCVGNPEQWLPRIKTAGAIFVGPWSPVAVGDFLAGPSHELPTGGAGKSFAGLTVDQFQRRTSIVRMDRAALEASAPVVAKFAEVEGLDAHGASVTVRLEAGAGRPTDGTP